jgi:CBS domain-containing protein
MFVRDRMSSPAVTITPNTTLQDALNLMHEHRFRRLPVVDEKADSSVLCLSVTCCTPHPHQPHC